jgi:uncharacterized Tic20 family protein
MGKGEGFVLPGLKRTFGGDRDVMVSVWHLVLPQPIDSLFTRRFTMSDPTTAAAASPAASLVAPPDTFPAGYIEADPVQRSQAKMANFLGIFGILGTGIYYALKNKEAGPFAKDQMKEAFNFHVLIFAVAVVLSILSTILVNIVVILGTLVGLLQMVVGLGALVLSILNGIKAGNGQVVRYPARIRVLK